MTPLPEGMNKFLIEGLVNKIVKDPGLGLVEAINVGFREMPYSVTYGNWIGDDDILSDLSLVRALSKLQRTQASFVFGHCKYIDSLGRTIGINKAGIFASRILGFGPDLIPQPGALFNLELFRELGGLDPKYKYAFDYDLFLRLKRRGKPVCVDEVQASFRWHPDSLSVKDRKKAVIEAYLVRQSVRGLTQRVLFFPIECSVVLITYLAGLMLNHRTKQMNK